MLSLARASLEQRSSITLETENLRKALTETQSRLIELENRNAVLKEEFVNLKNGRRHEVD